AASFKARFQDASEARACFHYSQVIDQLAVPSVSIYADAAQAVLDGPRDGGTSSTRRRVVPEARFAVTRVRERMPGLLRGAGHVLCGHAQGCGARLPADSLTMAAMRRVAARDFTALGDPPGPLPVPPGPPVPPVPLPDPPLPPPVPPLPPEPPIPQPR